MTSSAEHVPETSRLRSGMPGAAAWLFVIAATLFHILATLGASLRGGRLAVVPTYDDVAYLTDGLRRLRLFSVHGFSGLLHSLIVEPAHAPITTIIATLGFAIVPGEAAGSYALSGLWVILFMILMAVMLKDLPHLMLAGLAVALLAVPAMGSVMSEFRPDLSWGFIVGFAAIFLVLADFHRVSRLHAFSLGLLVGLGLIAKPTGFMPVLALLGVAYLVAVAIALWEGRSTVRNLVLSTLILTVGVILVAAPYYIVAAAEIIAYVRAVMLQDTDIWMLAQSTTDHLLFYGRLAYLALGWLWPSCFFIMGAHGAYLIWRDRAVSADLLRFLGVALTVALSYAIPTAAPAQSTYFGYFFYGPVIVASFWSLGFMLCRLRTPPFLVLLAGGAVFLLFWTPDPKYFSAQQPALVATDEANRAIAPAVVNVLGSADPVKAPLTVLNISPGPIALDILHYYALLKGRSATFGGIFRFKDWDELSKQIEAVDVNVVSETGALGQSPAHFPVYQYQNKIVAMLKTDPRWRVIASYTDALGFNTFAFARNPPLASTAAK